MTIEIVDVTIENGGFVYRLASTRGYILARLRIPVVLWLDSIASEV